MSDLKCPTCGVEHRIDDLDALKPNESETCGTARMAQAIYLELKRQERGCGSTLRPYVRPLHNPQLGGGIIVDGQIDLLELARVCAGANP